MSQPREWSPQQDAALKQIARWRKLGNAPYFTLAGYAGTGKTTMAEEIAENEPKDSVFFAAFTGKAAHVLRRHGIPATTIHKLIYLPHDKCDAHLRDLRERREALLDLDPVPEKELEKLDRLIARERKNLSRPDFYLNVESPLWDAGLLVIDEYSMIDEQMGQDLLSFGCPILALGDPGQLPPVHGRRFFTGKPDIMLTEIHRQAAHNPLIRMSKIVREGRYLEPGCYGESLVIHRADIESGDFDTAMLDADQVLVGRNDTRRSYNRVIRGHYKHEGDFPVVGDRVVCLKNNHDLGIFNGQPWTVLATKVKKGFVHLKLEGERDGENKPPVVSCYAHAKPFLGKELELGERRLAEEFDFGYALTVHKSQGSEWSTVFLDDEWNHDNRDKWLYTAITRAAEKITIVR